MSKQTGLTIAERIRRAAESARRLPPAEKVELLRRAGLLGRSTKLPAPKKTGAGPKPKRSVA